MLNANQVAVELKRSSSTRQDIFNFIIRFFEVNRTHPTLREIGEAIDIIQNKIPGKTSTDTVRHHLDKLEEQKKIERVGDRIVVSYSSWRFHGYRKVDMSKVLP